MSDLYSYRIYSHFGVHSKYEGTVLAENRKQAEEYVKAIPVRTVGHYFKIEGKGKRYVADKNL